LNDFAATASSCNFCSLVFLTSVSLPLSADRGRKLRKNAASPEPSTGDEDSSDSGEEGSSGSSDDGSDGDQASGHEENSPKVDITE
jgi:hypothetical protein